jgi:HK97 family phage major capsid protein
MTLKEIQEQMTNLLAANDALLAKGAEFTAEDAENVKANQDKLTDLNADRQKFAVAAASQKEAEALRKELSAAVQTFSQPDPSGARVLGFQSAGEVQTGAEGNGFAIKSVGPGHVSPATLQAISSAEYKSAWRKNLSIGWHNLSNVEQKALQEGIDSDGGFLVPEDMLSRILIKEPTPTRVAARVSSLNTSRDAITVPKINYSTDDLYTTGMRVTWTGEIPASSTTHRATDPVFGQLRIPVYTAMISLPITRDLVEDAAVDLVGLLSSKFSETIDLLYDNMILNGTGIGQPSGILMNPGGTGQPATVASGAAAALTADGLQDLIWSLPEQYDENAALVYNAKLKDGDGRYLWSMGAADNGLAPTIKGREILGYPSIWSGFMPNVGASAYPIVFGDLRGYQLVRRIGFSVQVLRELYAETNQLLLLGRVRFGGAVAEDYRLKIQTVSA